MSIGASKIGHKCKRYLWFVHNNIKPFFSAKAEANFAEGRRFEAIVVDSLKQKENIVDRDSHGKKFRLSHPDTPMISGEVDGIGEVLDENNNVTGKYILEVKSASAMIFAEMKSCGIEKVYPWYKSQLNCYIAWYRHAYQGVPCNTGKWVVINKETQEIYIEWLEFDEKLYKADTQRALSVFEKVIPDSPKMTVFCKHCEYRPNCTYPPTRPMDR